MTKNATETCVGSLILNKISDMVNKRSQQPATRTLLVLKAVMNNFGYLNAFGPPSHHSTGNAVDILCGEAVGLNNTVESSCPNIENLCREGSSLDIYQPAERYGCGNSPFFRSVHCAFFNRPILNLDEKISTDEAIAIVDEHYRKLEEKAAVVVTDTIRQAVSEAINKNLTAIETLAIVKEELEPKVGEIIKESYETRIIVNVTRPPRPLFFKSINFRIGGPVQAVDNILNRDRRAAEPEACRKFY